MINYTSKEDTLKLINVQIANHSVARDVYFFI